MEHDRGREPERISLDALDPVVALKALLTVDPQSEPVNDADERERDEPGENARDRD